MCTVLIQCKLHKSHTIYSLIRPRQTVLLFFSLSICYNNLTIRKAGHTMAENVKTNVMRILEKAGIAHHIHYYDPDKGIDGLSVAAQLGQDPQAVFKTLVTQGKSRAFYVFVIPVGATLSLKRAASVCGEKSIEMIPQKILLPTTGYIHGGCSPIGMKKAFPTLSTRPRSSLTPSASLPARSACRLSLYRMICSA